MKNYIKSILFPFKNKTLGQISGQLDLMDYELIKLLTILTREISSDLDLETLLQSASDTLVDFLKLHGCILFLKDPKGKSIYTKTISQSGQSRTALKLLQIDRFLDRLKADLTEKSNLVVDTVINDRVNESQELWRFTIGVLEKSKVDMIQRATSTGNCIAVPVKYKGDPIGALMFTKKQIGDSFSIELPLMQLYASQVAVAITNASLYEEQRSQLNLIADKNRQLLSIFEITNSIVSTLKASEVAQRAVDEIASNKDYIGGILSLIDDRNMLVVNAFTHTKFTEAAVGLLGKDITEYVIDLNDMRYGNMPGVRAIREDTLIATDSLKEVLSPIVPDSVIKALQAFLKVGSLVIMPVKISGQIIGLLTFFLKTKKSAELTDDDKSFMQTISQVIGVALQNAESFSEKEYALKRLNELNLKLEEKYDELKQVRERERDMMDIMGHELRTPLSIIKITLGAMELKAKRNQSIPSGEIYKQYIPKIKDALEREVELLETMLSSTKIDAHRIEFHFEKVNLKEVIADAMLAHKEKADMKGLDVKFKDADMHKELFVFADRVRLAEVIENLVGNGVKYTQDGHVHVSVDEQEDMYHVHVEDTGPGIPEEALPRLGEKFYRVKQYINDKEGNKMGIVRPGGTGLGLYVTFGLVKLMGGSVNVKSELGKGSVFSFTVPKYMGQAESEGEGGKDLFKRLGLKEGNS